MTKPRSKTLILPKPEFGDLPPARNRVRPSEWEPVIRALKANPRRWAKIAVTKTNSTATSIRRGQHGFLPAGAFEAESRAINADGDAKTMEIWARYVGAAQQVVIDGKAIADAGAAATKAARSLGDRVAKTAAQAPAAQNPQAAAQHLPGALCGECGHGDIRHPSLGECNRTGCVCLQYQEPEL